MDFDNPGSNEARSELSDFSGIKIYFIAINFWYVC